jgi:hypothetical protein
MCLITYFDRTGLYKHKIIYYPTPTGQDGDKSIPDNAAATAHVHCEMDTTTADSIFTSQPTLLQIANPTASPINQSIQRSLSELGSTSPAQCNGRPYAY